MLEESLGARLRAYEPKPGQAEIAARTEAKDATDAARESPLPRVLSRLEVYSFSLNGISFWIYAASAAYLSLGAAAVLLWIPTSLVGALTSLQSRHLARLWPDVVGGAPGCVRRLYPGLPWLGRYASMAYFQSWALVTPLAAVILGGALHVVLQEAGFRVDSWILIAVLLVAPYVVATGGTRSISMLHVLYMAPTLLLLCLFVLSGLAWIGLAADSPGPLPTVAALPPVSELALGWLLLTLATYRLDTATAFMSESKLPRTPFRALTVSAVLMPVLFVAAALVFGQANGGVADETDPFLGLDVPIVRIFGTDPGFFDALFFAGAFLLGSLTSLAVMQRVLFQQARDGHAAPVFGAASSRGVFGPALVASFAVAVAFAALAPLVNLAAVAGISWLLFFALMHLGSWNRRRSAAAWHPWPLGILGLFELAVVVVAAVSTDIPTAAIALLLPVALIGADAALRRAPVGMLSLAWWTRRYALRRSPTGSFARQLMLTSGLLTAFTAIAWWIGANIMDVGSADDETFAVVLLVSTLLGVAIAGRTSLAQFAAIDEAREDAQHASQRLKAEEIRLRGANLELHALNRTQAQFVSIVSHEFRTPLTGIQGFSEMIRDEELTIEEARDLANDINEDARRLGRMISEILDLDRMRSGRMTLHLEPMELNAVIRAVAARISIGAPDHPLVLALDDGLPGGEGDRDKLTQVITNLVNNAIKYSPGGSDIRISSAAHNGSLLVSIADSGMGISADALRHVFEPYSRVDTEATRDITGTGLGLPIAREIIRLHGGRLWAESVEGSGSTFHFTIARTIPPAEDLP